MNTAYSYLESLHLWFGNIGKVEAFPARENGTC